MTAVSATQRFTKDRPCPICGGHDRLPRGQGRRCAGFLSADGAYAHCSREEHAGQIAADNAGTYAHRLQGDCRCGVQHSAAPPPENGARPPRRMVAAYDYLDADGSLLMQTVRFEPKGFSQRRPDGAGGWAWNVAGVKRVLYRLPELLAAPEADPVLVCEGEKDVDRARAEGFRATTTPMGAGKADHCDLSPLKGRHVIIIPDRDKPGSDHAAALVRLLTPLAATVRRLNLPGTGKDLSDYLDAGGTAAELRKLIETSDPEATERSVTRAVDGEAWLFSESVHISPFWGDGDNVLGADGESLMIFGPDGVGKTALAQQLTLARCGLREKLLGLPVKPSASKVFYGAHDRPQQARRSMYRMVSEADRPTLRERLVIWPGPLPFDVAEEPEALPALILEHGCDTYVCDGLKDIAVDLSKDAVGARINHALQLCLAAGIQVIVLHWQRKAQGDNKKPNKIADIYGSRLIVAGFGSIIVLWGEAGDPIVELLHLKQPAQEVGPFQLQHDHDRGETTILERVDAYALVYSHNGISANYAATQLYRTEKPTANQVKKAERALNSLVKRGLAHRVDGARGGGPDARKPALWYAVEQSREQSRGGFEGEQSREAEAIPLDLAPDSESNPASNPANPAPSNPVFPSLFIERETDAQTPEECEEPDCFEPQAFRRDDGKFVCRGHNEPRLCLDPDCGALTNGADWCKEHAKTEASP